MQDLYMRIAGKNNSASLRLLPLAAVVILGSVFVGELLLPEVSQMFSRHMLSHILLMNLAAPLLAAVLHHRLSTVVWLYSLRVLIATSILQLLLLLGWHLPVVTKAVMTTPALSLVMQISLFVTALLFWQAIFQQASAYIWRALASLLITGKLYCLMAALLVFAPRSLYFAPDMNSSISLADQQLAGVMMVVACPLSYVLIATALVARWLTVLREKNESLLSRSGMPAA